MKKTDFFESQAYWDIHEKKCVGLQIKIILYLYNKCEHTISKIYVEFILVCVCHPVGRSVGDKLRQFKTISWNYNYNYY